MGDHAIVIARHEVDQPRGSSECVAHYAQRAETLAHAGWGGKPDGNNKVGLGCHLHCRLRFIVKAPHHRIARREGREQTWQWWIRVHQLLPHVLSKFRPFSLLRVPAQFQQTTYEHPDFRVPYASAQFLQTSKTQRALLQAFWGTTLN